jgi:acyl-CoA thioester hydrolase
VKGSEPVEIWRGGVALSDCDEMGHMNVRRYLARAQEGLGGLAVHLGLPQAFTPSATATLVVMEHRIRFLAEARVGAPLYMTGGVFSFGTSDATLLQTIHHAETGQPAAAFLTRVAHAKPSDGRAFPWPDRAKLGAEGLRVELPDFAAPRGLQPSNAAVERTLASQAADDAAKALVGRPIRSPKTRCRNWPNGRRHVQPDAASAFGFKRARPDAADRRGGFGISSDL